jgi:hypothetical protein
MINCKDCKRYNDAGLHKSCLAGKWEVFISGDVVLSPEMVECDAAVIERISYGYEGCDKPESVSVKVVDRRTKAYKDSLK